MKDSANSVAVKRPKKKGKPRLVRRRPRHPLLRFTPYAWAKLLYLRDAGPTEIGGFGVSSTEDLLLVRDVQLVNQRCDWASVELDDTAVADYFDRQVDDARTPEEFGRTWVHTHPASSAEPSATDEETFGRVFGSCDWAVMFILARHGASYARLQLRTGPGGSFQIPVEVAYDEPFAGSDEAAWEAEYQACVTGPSADVSPLLGGHLFAGIDQFDRWGWLDRCDQSAGLTGEEAFYADDR